MRTDHDDNNEKASGQQLLTWVPRLRRYARALASNRDDADDLVQDTLERACAKSSLWLGVTDMRAWLFSIMHNVHVDGIRRPGLATVALDDETPEAPVAPTQDDRLAVLDLQAALEQLPAEQREIMLLVALEDMSYAEVAATLGIPIGSVMSRLSRGRERLRSLLTGHVQPVRLKVVK
ncbi:RNA polymerase sigma factor [Polaromonas sp. CG_23.6]|uniref:RNA polymerase sigma factor n=1 Tax=unclassified Polaromonas TaxID=2638319 RepID=UPI0018CA1293|nr:sigma-70 family RNA polymerase sigma factor [Polaromonas sp. CG_23.6]MBG6070433.1 RNA polymerase sigma-70 factor (ECF subfamily) [Polaromonas sp. CG_9.7]MBG6112431.1 RNA polymerase sigma-70 factor (ECF subfamily) [Polaromonas sp. CG_9.2]MDH6184078.1 RNA polymerase sigma-70 factor (ECF subfamily) [Polaromonas sp. CG_23.6]